MSNQGIWTSGRESVLEVKRPCECGCDRIEGGYPGVGYLLVGNSKGEGVTLWIETEEVYSRLVTALEDWGPWSRKVVGRLDGLTGRFDGLLERVKRLVDAFDKTATALEVLHAGLEVADRTAGDVSLEAALRRAMTSSPEPQEPNDSDSGDAFGAEVHRDGKL